jgi:DNA adenine methylase
MHTATQARVTPLLKWAGGKRQLLPALSGHYPARFRRYFEPFFGSGAVFFDLFSRGRLTGRQVRLSDANPDLIGCYQTLRDRPGEVISALHELEREHRERGEACYYAVRDQRFNPLRAAIGTLDRRVADAYTPELAAMLIFLNRTGFNGLFRLNRRGGFNVPAGRYTDPRICDPAHLRSVAEAFREPGVSIRYQGFADALAETRAGDFVYCDPPYEPLSPTASFTNYTAQGFSMFEQRRLQQTVVEACRRGAFVVVSNSSAPAILETYAAPAASGAGLRLELVAARRAINSRGSARGTVNEVIVSNVRPELNAVRPRMLRAQPRAKRKSA